MVRANSVSQLGDHLTQTHSDLTDISELKRFVENYITIEEALTSDDSDRELELEPVISTEVLPNFFCPYCDSVFSSTARLLSHLNQHVHISLEQGVQCCGDTFNARKMLVKHLQEHHVSRVVDKNANHCRTCGYEAENVHDLQDHVSNTHNEADSRKAESSKKRKKPSSKNQKFIPAVCPECNEVFSNKYNMFVHMKSHGKATEQFACDVCNKMYSNQGNLNSHKRIAHEGVLKFVCTDCGEAFPTRLARTVHARIHSGVKPYSCEYCSKSFRAKNTLDRHIEMHLDIRKHLCHMCPKKFRKKTHLTYHLNTHKKDIRDNTDCLLQVGLPS